MKPVSKRILIGTLTLAALAGLGKIMPKPTPVSELETVSKPYMDREILGNEGARMREGYADRFNLDVTGDGIGDEVVILGKGFDAFYLDGAKQRKNPAYDEMMYHRIRAGTPEALRLWKVKNYWLRDSEGW